MPAATPPVVVEPFANTGLRNAIPVAQPVDPAKASLDAGFPGITMASESSGGLPPYGQDMNGILYMLSSHTVWQQAGQPYLYNATLATALGGYAIGTLLGMSDGSGLWMNRTAANTTDPDAGGAGWVAALSYGFATLTGLTGGVATLTPAQARRGVVVLQGTLTSNLQVVFPVTQQEWLVVNQTSGAFTATVKTASGTGVTVPASGLSAPTGVYGDGVNLYPSVAPLSVTIDQSASGLSVAQRTSAGYLLATYFNQSSPSNENPTAGSVFVESGGDGYLRKVQLVAFSGQLLLQNLSGALNNPQVPLAAIAQYYSNIWDSPALTNTPTGPTAAVGTNTGQLATTQFAVTQGVGSPSQAYADVTGSRGLGTDYTNSTGRPIFAAVSIGLFGGGNTATLVVGGVNAASVVASGGNAKFELSGIVPAGAVYRVNAGGVIDYAWTELR